QAIRYKRLVKGVAHKHGMLACFMAKPFDDLAAAALLAGVHRGIREGIDPGAPVEGNGYAQAGKRLPTDWLTALDALQGSEWAREAFGEPFLGVYLAVKRAEYRQFMGEVGE
ncbi:hypothetical protein ACV34U_30280, partial [Pseudomonas aeruginosa]